MFELHWNHIKMRSARNVKRIFFKPGYIRRQAALSASRLAPVQRENVGFRGCYSEAIWPFLAVGQIFGVLPVCGIKSSTFYFKWTALRTFHSLIVMIVLIAYSLFLIWQTLKTDTNYFTISLLLFYITNTCELISFFVLASHWPEIMKCWENVERNLPTFRNFRRKKNFILKIRLIAFTMLFLAATENIVATHSKYCLIVGLKNGQDPYQEILKVQGPLINLTEPIALWIVLCAKFINISATFVWNFSDIFITTISIALSTQFKLLSAEMNRGKCKHASEIYWAHRRAEYGKLRDLVAMIDERICHITFLSFFINFFFTCKQLFKSLKPHSTCYRMVYFWFSLILLIFRGMIVSFSAASVHDESKKPINVLRNVPSQGWKTETKRFFSEIVSENIALSGLRFFYVTRPLILSVIGMITTYELVLTQFNIHYN